MGKPVTQRCSRNVLSTAFESLPCPRRDSAARKPAPVEAPRPTPGKRPPFCRRLRRLKSNIWSTRRAPYATIVAADRLIGVLLKEKSSVAKGRHRVSFTAKKPAEVPVKFKTRDGEQVKFDARKDVPTKVSFLAKD